MGINNISSNDINRNFVGSREKLTETKIDKNDVIDSVEKPIIPQNEGIIFSLSKEGLARAREGYAVAKIAATNTSNQQYQAYLSALGFYSGSMDGNMTSQASKKAISNFQRVYGLSNTGTFDSSTKSKLESAYSSYYSVYTSSNFGTLNTRPRFNLDHNEQVNFARTWAFLRVGMGLNSAQTSAVMGNINQESRFASDNANDRLYPGDHNTGYSFRANDGIAYGIVQWQYNSRKQGLLNTANSMGLSVSDINAQFAYLRSEATGSYASAWSNTKNAGDVGSKTITFMRQFEQVNDGTDDKRVENANAIYNLLSGF